MIPNNSENEIIIHIGITKTGSSALQVSFIKNLDLLKKHNIRYPDVMGRASTWASERGMGTGNANIDSKFLWPSEDRLKRLEWLILESDKSIRNNEKMLLASEMISTFAITENFWKQLSHIQNETQRKIRVVAYVRDPFKRFLACYQQVVKLCETQNSLDEFVDMFLNQHFHSSFSFQKHLSSIFDYAKMHDISFNVYRFEEADGNIQKHFFENVLNIPEHGFDFATPKVNVGLSPVEVEFHRGINSSSKRLAQLLGWELTDSQFVGSRDKATLSGGFFYVSEQNLEKLISAFESYKESIRTYVDFSDEIDCSVPVNLIKTFIDNDEEKYRSQIYELGKFIGISYENGYIDWARGIKFNGL